jgi:hypothetical protein
MLNAIRKLFTIHASFILITAILTRPDPTRHDPKINESDMNLIFLTQIESGRVRINSTRSNLLFFVEVFL